MRSCPSVPTLGLTPFLRLLSGLAFLFIAHAANAQCVTLSPWLNGEVSVSPGVGPGCPGNMGFAVCGPAFTFRVVNIGTGAVAYGNLSGCGASGAGCPGNGCGEANGWQLVPGQYVVEVMSGNDPCATFPFSIPGFGPNDELVLDEGNSALPGTVCDGPGWLEVGYSLPSPNCLPPVTSRMYFGTGPFGPWIDGVINGGLIRFDGVPLFANYFITASAGPLSNDIVVPGAAGGCPSLGGAPSTEDASPSTPGRIYGAVPQLGCPPIVVVVAVQSNESMPVSWESANAWSAAVPAGQYAVAITVGGGACVEEYLVEVGGGACAAVAVLELVVAQTTGTPNGSVTYALSNTDELPHVIRLTDTGSQEESTSGGTVTVLIDQLYAGEYTAELVGPSGCQTTLANVIIPCLTELTVYRDQDGDGDGAPGTGVPFCVAEPGYILDWNPTDCDDNDPSVNNGVMARLDVDGDGYGMGPTQLRCGALTDGWRPASSLSAGDDCNDTNAAIWGPVGASCDDGDPCTANDVIQIGCGCVGLNLDLDGDGICDGMDLCDEVAGTIGSPCDDGDPGTQNDQLNGSCECVGTSCIAAITIRVWTDANGDQISWTLQDLTSNSMACSGSDLANNTSVSTSCCMQAFHCYKLTVTDSGGDGILGGGYSVTTIGGERIIDNRSGFSTGTTSSINEYASFCWGLGTAQLQPGSCDRTNWRAGDIVACTTISGVVRAWVNGGPSAQSTNTGYEFWFFDPNGGFSAHYFRSLAGQSNDRIPFVAVPGNANNATRFKINGSRPSALEPHLMPGRMLNVRVRGRINGENLPYGPACRFMMDPTGLQGPGSALQANPFDDQHTMLYPNPNNGDMVMVVMDHLPTAIERVGVSFLDMVGKEVLAQQLAVQDGLVRGTIDLHDHVSPGVYLVVLTAGDRTHTTRLVVQ